jgi:hypothetical protein
VLHNSLEPLRGARIDIVLDNSGFEVCFIGSHGRFGQVAYYSCQQVFCDLCLAHWLTQAGYAAEVVLHGKAMPWFVSDVTESDLTFVLNELCNSEGWCH